MCEGDEDATKKRPRECLPRQWARRNDVVATLELGFGSGGGTPSSYFEWIEVRWRTTPLSDLTPQAI